jgi:cryptochrome
MAPARVLYWFRTDLRLHDSPALAAALELGGKEGIEAFYPVSLSCVLLEDR